MIFTMLPAVSLQNNSAPKPPPLTVIGESEVIARSALAVDLLTGEILFQKNIYESLPLASLSKIISSLVIVEHLNLDEYVEVTKKAVETEEPSTLRVGEHLKIEDLLAMAMGESSNDAMMALVEHTGDEKWFLELMRQKAPSMVFKNPTGLDIKPTQTEFGSNYGSATALAQLIKNNLDSPIWQFGEKNEVISKEGIAHKIKHTNILRKELSGIYGAKTGFTDSAGGNLVLIVERPIGKPKAIIILGSTLEERFEEARKIVTLLK